MAVTRCIWQYHDQNNELQEYFDGFRHVTNEAIRLGLERGLTSRKSFHDSLYTEIDSNLYSSVKQNAIFHAKSLLKTVRTNIRKGREAGVPYVRQNKIMFNNQACKIKDGVTELCIATKTKIRIKLTSYILKQLENNSSCKVGGMEITPFKLIITYFKKVPVITKAVGCVGIDMNFNNVTTCDSNGKITVYDTSKILKKKLKCRKTVSNFKRNDHRIRKKK